MQAFQGLRQALVVAPNDESVCPVKRALYNPTTWQQDKAFLGLWQFDDFQLDTMLGCRLLRFRSTVALVNKCQFDTLPGDILDC